MIASFDLLVRVVLRGLAQLALADQAKAGLLVLAAILLVSPWAALGALIGCAWGSGAGFALRTYKRTDWLRGLAGFNGAIIGILWSGFPSAGEPRFSLLLLALMLCVTLEPLLRMALDRSDRPTLSLPAVLSAMTLSLLLADRGTWLWFSADQPPLGNWGVALAALCVLAAAATTSRAAALQAGILGACAALLYLALTSSIFLSVGTFWAMTVALASFALQGVFLRGRPDAALFGALAALAAALVALLWIASPLVNVAQPLLAPFILGVWLCLPLSRLAADHGLSAPDFWPVLRTILVTHWRHGRIIAITGSELASDPDRGDFAHWLRAEQRRGHSSGERYGTARTNQRGFWDLCDRYRSELADRTVRPAEASLIALERQGWLAGRISLTSGFPPATPGCPAIALYGDPNRVVCRDCHGSQDWPKTPLWRRFELRCPSCKGSLKPAITLPGEVASGPVWQQALAALEAADNVLFLGIERASPEVDRLHDAARRLELKVLVIGETAPPFRIRPNDLSLIGRFDRSLAPLTRLLSWLQPAGPRRRTAAAGVGQANTAA